SVGKRMVHAFPTAPRRAFATRVAELQAEFGAALAMDKVADALPRTDLRVGIDARAAGCDPRLLGNRRHLGEHQPSAAHAEAPKMHQMEIAGYAAGLGRIHVHRRDHDAVLYHQLADPERREHRWRIVGRYVETLG